MPVQPDPARGPHGRVLLDADGAAVGRYDQGLREGIPVADLFDREPGVGAEQAAAAVLADLRGMKIAGDEELGRALVAAGGKPLRHGHMYSYDFTRNPRPSWDEPPGIRLTDIDRPVADMVASQRAAYPPGHPDHGAVPEEIEAELHALIHGGQFGPLLPGSGLAVTDDSAVVGAIILGTVPGDPPVNGPWIVDIYRDPAYRGVGRALLRRALALAPVDRLGLIVTEGNDPARRLYESLGFDLISSALVVQI